jgi:hypothetical protein
MQPMLLEDAMALVCLYGDAGDPKYPVAVRRWMARWLVEEQPRSRTSPRPPARLSSGNRPLVRSGESTLAEATAGHDAGGGVEGGSS